ncbi:MAG: universal stress protein [Saprospiraceae bacterium]|nr:universal stress protein [Saprospiraceae bacterium]
MQKRFIVLIDFSDYSANLLKYAYSWSTEIGAEILLIHQTSKLISSRVNDALRESVVQQNISESIDELKNFAFKIAPEATNIRYDATYQHLNLHLADLRNEQYDNMILVGLKGTGILKQIFIGSYAVEIIEQTDTLLAAIPKEVTRFSPKKIFVAVTDKPPLNLTAFEKFLAFLDHGIESINFSHLSKPGEHNEDTEQQLNDLCSRYKDKYTTRITIYEGKNPFENIKKVINNKTEEILVVQKGSRLLTDPLFRKFLINDLVYEGHTPLVVLP